MCGNASNRADRSDITDKLYQVSRRHEIRTVVTSSTSTSVFQTEIVTINGHLIALVPADASAALPSRGQVAVQAVIADQKFFTVVEPDGRRGHWIKLPTDPPSPFRTRVGERLSLTLSVASEWPEPVVPDDLASALGAAPDLAELWESITPMARWEWVRWVQATANDTTRARRVEVSISKMRSGKRRPCCFDLSACTDPRVSKSGKLLPADS